MASSFLEGSTGRCSVGGGRVGRRSVRRRSVGRRSVGNSVSGAGFCLKVCWKWGTWSPNRGTRKTPCCIVIRFLDWEIRYGVGLGLSKALSALLRPTRFSFLLTYSSSSSLLLFKEADRSGGISYICPFSCYFIWGYFCCNYFTFSCCCLCWHLSSSWGFFSPSFFLAADAGRFSAPAASFGFIRFHHFHQHELLSDSPSAQSSSIHRLHTPLQNIFVYKFVRSHS